MILHPTTNKPNIKLIEGFKDGKKQCEVDITDMTADQVWNTIKEQEYQGRSWNYKTIKPYNWPRFDGEEVSNDK